MEKSLKEFLKEYFTEEKRKLKELSPKARVQYIWDYYRLWILGIFSAVFLVCFVFYHYFFEIKEYWFSITFTNTYAEIGNNSDFWEEFVKEGDFDLTQKKVEFNNSSYFDYENNVTGNAYFETFVAMTETGTLDAITMKCSGLKALGETGRLLDLNAESCRSIKEKYGDRFIYAKPLNEEYSTEEIPVAIDISDSILMTRYQIYKENCALAIGANSEHIENVELFLDFIYQK